MTCFAVYLKLLDGSIAQIVDALCAQKSYDSVWDGTTISMIMSIPLKSSVLSVECYFFFNAVILSNIRS